jgi:hypothetical protein
VSHSGIDDVAEQISETLAEQEKEEPAPRTRGEKHASLFYVYLAFVGAAMALAIFAPRQAMAEEMRNRLSWNAPPQLVADVLMREAVDGRAADARCLANRADALETAGLDGTRNAAAMDNLTASRTGSPSADRRASH